MRLVWFPGWPAPACHLCPGRPARLANGILLCAAHAGWLDAQAGFAVAAGAEFLIVHNEGVVTA